MSEGQAPPEPEIADTPRGGAVVNHRIAIHFAHRRRRERRGSVPDDAALAVAVPGLNKWLGDRIGPPDSLQFSVHYDLDGDTRPSPLAELGAAADRSRLSRRRRSRRHGRHAPGQRRLTELEVRIDHAYRVARVAARSRTSIPRGRTTILFMSRDGFPRRDVRTLFEMLPLLRTLRDLVTTCRPLGAGDYRPADGTEHRPGGGRQPDGLGSRGVGPDAGDAASGAAGRRSMRCKPCWMTCPTAR